MTDNDGRCEETHCVDCEYDCDPWNMPPWSGKVCLHFKGKGKRVEVMPPEQPFKVPQHLMDDILESAHVESEMDDALWCHLLWLEESIVHYEQLAAHYKGTKSDSMEMVAWSGFWRIREARDNLIANLDRAWGMDNKFTFPDGPLLEGEEVDE